MIVSPEGFRDAIATQFDRQVMIKDERDPENPILSMGKIIGVELKKDRVHVLDNRGIRFISGVGLICDVGYDTNPRGAVRFGRIPLTPTATKSLFPDKG